MTPSQLAEQYATQLRDVRLIAEDEWSHSLEARVALKAVLARLADLERLREKAQPVTLPTKEGWWFEWQPVGDSGIWFPKWCQNDGGWEWEDSNCDWQPCQPGHWLEVPMPPMLVKGGE